MHLHIVTNMAIAKQRVGKHVPAATNMLVEMKALPQD
jgi:hypothetical protein